MGQIPNFGAPPDSSLTISGKAADAKVVGNKINEINNKINSFGSLGNFQSAIFNMGGEDGSTTVFKIKTNDNTNEQLYRQYFIIFMIDQNGGLFASTLVWRGYSGEISTSTFHGSGSITHSNGTITLKTDTGTWGRTFVFWAGKNIQLTE